MPFDLERWRKVAEKAGPLPEPWSDDPTQWLFEGPPGRSTAPLQVAVARLVGYRWPEQPETTTSTPSPTPTGSSACLGGRRGAGAPSGCSRCSPRRSAAVVAGEGQANCSQRREQEEDLADWLRDEFFKQHCALFGNRPFVWHIWDGQGRFSALVNYHRLDRKTLEKLTYTYLGDWIERQTRRAARRRGRGRGAAGGRVGAAAQARADPRRRAAYDIYVRWKPLAEQPIGWEPDLNDGVRLNIRPFVEAGVLRRQFNVHWNKDRGKNPDGSERHNDLHLTIAEKQAARGERT